MSSPPSGAACPYVLHERARRANESHDGPQAGLLNKKLYASSQTRESLRNHLQRSARTVVSPSQIGEDSNYPSTLWDYLSHRRSSVRDPTSRSIARGGTEVVFSEHESFSRMRSTERSTLGVRGLTFRWGGPWDRTRRPPARRQSKTRPSPRTTSCGRSRKRPCWRLPLRPFPTRSASLAFVSGDVSV